MNNTKLIFFDVDGTLIDGMEYIYEHLWEYFGVDKNKTRETIQRYIKQELSYEDWIKSDVQVLQEHNATKQKIIEAVMSLHPTEGAVDMLRALKNLGYKIIAFSGGFDLVIQAVYGEDARLLFDEVFTNQYHFDEQGKLVDVTPVKYGMENRAQCLTDSATKYGAELKNCVFVGNNESDVEAALLAGTSIAFNSKSERQAFRLTN
jgi:phosphoserine phosphatase